MGNSFVVEFGFLQVGSGNVLFCLPFVHYTVICKNVIIGRYVTKLKKKHTHHNIYFYQYSCYKKRITCH